MEIFLVLVMALAIIVMSTLGAVLLARFWIGKWSGRKRVIVAVLLGPGAILIPTSLIPLAEAGDVEASLALFLFGLFFCTIIGWPVAHFATKALDRLTVFDIETFE